MNNAYPKNLPSPEADLAEVTRHLCSGGVKDPELLKRVTERANKARQEILDKFGVQDIGVDIIREMRDSE